MRRLLNYVTFWATSLNNPTSVGVAGNVKGVLSTITGLIMGAKLTTVAAAWPTTLELSEGGV